MVFLPPHMGEVLPFAPLPENASRAAYASLQNRGFAAAAILETYRYTSRDGSFTLNALAFNDPRRRTPDEYAGITLYNALNGTPDEQIVPILAQTAAPFHVIHRGDRFAFWASTVQDALVRPVPIETNIAYDHLDPVLTRYAIDLQPQRILDIKQGRAQFSIPFFRDNIETHQLTLWAFNVTRDLLVQHFGHAVAALRNYPVDDHLDAIYTEQIVVDLSIQLLGAVILADTGGLGTDIRLQGNQLSLQDLIAAAYREYPAYFQQDLFRQYADPAAQAFYALRQICYAGFAPDMLSQLYRTAYDHKQRKRLGRFDTPLYLTRRIWDTIPVEFLPPEQRITVDMTCGWGSFLIAGYDRLSQISDMRSYPLRDYLYGNDSDRFAARLAGLGLLLSTSADHWFVDNQDALTWNWLNTHQPGIIVGNSPFVGDRKTPRTESTISSADRKRYQTADQYLAHAIEHLALGGYLAFVMPLSFVGAESSPQLRKKLLRFCDMLEIWELPLEVFPDATASTMVIFAQKKAKEGKLLYPVRLRTVQKHTLQQFVAEGIFTASSVASNQDRWDATSRKSTGSENTHIIDYRLILPEFIWNNIRLYSVPLSSCAILFSGAIEGKNVARKRWRNYPDPKRVPWLTGAKDVLPRPFVVSYTNETTILYPNELEKPRKYSRESQREKDKERFFEGTKVLLVSDPNPSWGKRVKVAIERRGYYVSHSFWVIVPQPSVASFITYEVLAAVLNWYVSNAFIVEHLKYPWIVSRAIQNIPFPKNFSKTDCDMLTQAVHQLETAAYAGQHEPLDATTTIDAILKTAYGLDDATFERLQLIAEWDQHPQTTLDPQPDIALADYLMSGVVEQVDAEQGTITLWMNGFDELQTVPIDPRMPGWMLRPEAAFRAYIPYACKRNRNLAGVVWGRIVPQQYTYLDEEALVESLTNVFYPEGTCHP